MSKSRPLICVFAGASTPNDPAILEAAYELGSSIGSEGYDILYGAGSRGVMGAVTRAAYETGANIHAIAIERFAADEEMTPFKKRFTVKDEIERYPAFVGEKPVAFFVLPGGSGTLREAMQGIESGIYDDGPPVVLTTGPFNYLDGIKHYFESSVKAGLIRESKRDVLREWTPGQPIADVLAKGAKQKKANAPSIS